MTVSSCGAGGTGSPRGSWFLVPGCKGDGVKERFSTFLRERVSSGDGVSNGERISVFNRLGLLENFQICGEAEQKAQSPCVPSLPRSASGC